MDMSQRFSSMCLIDNSVGTLFSSTGKDTQVTIYKYLNGTWMIKIQIDVVLPKMRYIIRFPDELVTDGILTVGN